MLSFRKDIVLCQLMITLSNTFGCTIQAGINYMSCPVSNKELMKKKHLKRKREKNYMKKKKREKNFVELLLKIRQKL